MSGGGDLLHVARAAKTRIQPRDCSTTMSLQRGHCRDSQVPYMEECGAV